MPHALAQREAQAGIGCARREGRFAMISFSKYKWARTELVMAKADLSIAREYRRDAQRLARTKVLLLAKLAQTERDNMDYLREHGALRPMEWSEW